MHPAQRVTGGHEVEGTWVLLAASLTGVPGEGGESWGGGAEPPQVFLLLDVAHGRVQVLLSTFESVRKQAGKAKGAGDGTPGTAGPGFKSLQCPCFPAPLPPIRVPRRERSGWGT